MSFPAHWRWRRARGWGALLGLSLSVVCPAAAGAGPLPLRLALLGPAGRASLVLELAAPPSSVSHRSDGEKTLVLDLGPVLGSVQRQNFSPTQSASAFVVGVSVSEYLDVKGQTFVRVQVHLGEGCRASVRTTGARVYVDVVPGVPSAPTAPALVAATRPPPPDSRGETSYEALEALVARRAPGLASKPDVNALLGIRAQITEREKDPEPAELARAVQLLAEIDRYLAAARARQLTLDGLALQGVR